MGGNLRLFCPATPRGAQGREGEGRYIEIGGGTREKT